MNIRRNHHLGLPEARKRAERIAADLHQQFSLTSEWRGDTLNVKGKGVNGQLRVDDSHFELDLKLGFALKLMEGPIRSVIDKMIEKELA